MKSNRKTLFQRISSLVITAALSVQLVSVPGMATTAFAAGTDAEAAVVTASARADSNRVTALLSGYTPTVNEVVHPDSGFTHPGVGVTKELLDNVQTQVRNGTEPWKSYFETMLLDRTDLTGRDVGPTWNRVDYTQQSQNGAFKKDASTAYAQAVMYYITGDNAYRRNAMRIIRAYENVDPEQMAYFNDACIHTGIPTNRMCIAAEILRYSSYQVTDGYTDAELKWTDADTEKFISNFLSPEVEVFQYSPDRFMNQHLYTTIGAMSAYLFMDDAESYEKAVEWFTVNRGAVNQGSTGSIQRLFREITTVDVIGGKEGAGPKLSTPVIQHMEMGRDQAHGCGDLTNSAILARLMQGQGTKVDPGDGTVSTAQGAVDCYTFLDDRLVKAADFFFEYMLGYDAEWVPAPYSIDKDGNIIAMYADFSTEYRGRYTTINFWDFYAYYRYNRNMSPADIQAAYPYFYEGYGKKIYAAWDNDDGGGDFWLFLPAEAAGDTSFIPVSGEANVIDVTVRGTVVSDRRYADIETGDGESYVHITPSEAGSVICVNTAGIGAGTVLLKVRTNCVAKLNITGDIYLPDTEGQWAYVSYNCPGLGDMYYLTVSDMPSDVNGAYVDISAIYTNPTESNLSAVVFDSGNEDCNVSTYTGAFFSKAFPAADTVKGASVSYSLVNAPDGAAVGEDGSVTWTPGEAGDISFYIMAKAGDSAALKRIHATVAADRAAALANVLSAYDENTAYITASRKDFDRIRAEIELMVDDENVSEADFSAKLSELADAVAKLELVSPPLLNDPLTEDDPDGPSLDFRDMNLGNRSTLTNPAVSYPGLWLDNNPSSFVQYTQVETVNGRQSSIIDFGVDYKISVSKFGFQARAGFPSRVGGVQVFGSNDRSDWELLTDGQAENISDYQTVNVLDEVKNNQYRYLMIQKTTLYPDATSGIADSLLEFGEMRIWGTRYETGNLIESISMTSDDLKNGCIKMGATVKVTIQGRDVLNDLTVSINGVDATITQGAGYLYTATAVMSSDRCTAGNVSLEVNYKKLDGTAGAPFYGTTDGTTLLLVNSDAFIDTGKLAAELYASSPAWGGGADSGVEAAGRLFDGDITNWGELSNREGDYYVVDFGENAKVALDDVMMMPRSTAADHAARLNGTVIYGSNDVEHENYAEKEWSALTQPVSGAAMGIWSHASVSDHTPYRFLKITGGTLCCISEVEFYGSYHSDVNSIAAQITSLPEQGALQSTLLCPSLPAGFTFTVESSSDESVIKKDGTLFAKADEDTDVTVTLNIMDQEGQTAVTAPITVTVKSLKSAITGLSAAAKGAATLALPEVPDGFKVTVQGSSNESIVANGSGAITTPARDSLVNVTLVLTRISDNVSAQCGPYDVLVYGSQVSGKLDVESLKVEWEPITGGNDVTKVFDGREDTFADLNSGNTHTVNFGEIKVIPVKFRLYPRSDSNDTNAGRTNNTVIEGSNDGQTWIRLTEPVSGVKKGTWIEIEGTQFVNYGSFNYLRITGGTRGSLAELEVYGVVDTTAAALAATITSLPDVEAGETSLTLPTLPAGFTVAFASSDNTDVITQEGQVKLPAADTLVNVTLTVTGPDGDTADTAAIPVLVKGIPLTLENPADTDTKLTMPTVPDGFTVEITGTEPMGIIANDGTITRSRTPALVNVTLALKNAADQVIKTETCSVLVNGTLQPVKLDVVGLAFDMYASAAESWSGLDERQVARKLFDGDLTNHCEPTGANERTTYTVDFGEGVQVSPTQFRLYPRSNSNTANAERMNGTVVKGSNDGTTWVDITEPVTGTRISTWTEIGIEQFVGYGSYRYFQITGAKVGNIAEVEIYGVMEAGAAALAAAIPAPPDVEPGKNLALPTMPSGYSITVSSSDPSGIIAADGTVTTPGNDTVVTAELQITDPDGGAATKNIAVTVKGIELVLNNPGADDTTLTLPSVPDGFTVSIVDTSNADVIDTNGNISRSEDPVVVTVTLALRDAQGSEVKRASFDVFVSGTGELKQVNVAGLATVVASCKQWANPAGSGLDESAVAALLFDGDIGTFGDLQDTNGYYTIDFGEGVAVLPAQFRLYPRSTADNHAQRMNNTVIYGSNDGTNWEPVTEPVAGAVKGQWYTIEADQFVNYGSYRYFKIAGGAGGNIAEVEIYGVVYGSDEGYLSDADTAQFFSLDGPEETEEDRFGALDPVSGQPALNEPEPEDPREGDEGDPVVLPPELGDEGTSDVGKE